MEKVGVYEAKTHLPQLLERVAAGETITITKHGVPIAVLSPYNSISIAEREEAIARIIALRRQNMASGQLKEWIEEGRL